MRTGLKLRLLSTDWMFIDEDDGHAYPSTTPHDAANYIDRLERALVWHPIKTAPKDRHFLAYTLPNTAESNLLVQLGLPPADGNIQVVHRRKGDKPGKVRGIVRGETWMATHWMELPQPPKGEEQ